METPKHEGNSNVPPKTIDEALAKLRANPKVIKGFEKRNEELERLHILPSSTLPKKVLRPPYIFSKSPTKHFSETDQPELVQINGEWVRKDE